LHHRWMIINMAVFDLDKANEILQSGFAPWVLDLGLSVEAVSEKSATLLMPYSDRIRRSGDIVCGQSIMALVDTAAVFAVIAAIGRLRPLTTVDQSCHFLKPGLKVDHLAAAHVMRLGRNMAFARVDVYPVGNQDTPVAAAQVACALLPE